METCSPRGRETLHPFFVPGKQKKATTVLVVAFYVFGIGLCPNQSAFSSLITHSPRAGVSPL